MRRSRFEFYDYHDIIFFEFTYIYIYICIYIYIYRPICPLRLHHRSCHLAAMRTVVSSPEDEN